MTNTSTASPTGILKPAVQIAYFVSDIRSAAERMHRSFGAGPFYVIENIRLARAEHRGESCLFVHSSAYGQWGSVMLELVQQDVEGPSPFRDLFPPGAEGLHHVATFVDDVEAAIDAYAKAGLPLATRAWTTSGTQFAFVDARATLGHMIELYVPDAGLQGFYDFIRDASIGWDGRDPVRTLGAS